MTVTLEATVQLALEKAHHALQCLDSSNARDCINNFVALSIESRQREEHDKASRPEADLFKKEIRDLVLSLARESWVDSATALTAIEDLDCLSVKPAKVVSELLRKLLRKHAR